MHFLKFVGLGPSAKSRALNCKNKGIAKSANISATNRPTDQPTDHVAWWSVGLSVGHYMVGHKKNIVKLYHVLIAKQEGRLFTMK